MARSDIANDYSKRQKKKVKTDNTEQSKVWRKTGSTFVCTLFVRFGEECSDYWAGQDYDADVTDSAAETCIYRRNHLGQWHFSTKDAIAKSGDKQGKKRMKLQLSCRSDNENDREQKKYYQPHRTCPFVDTVFLLKAQ